MQDQYTGEAGTYYTDPAGGKRLTKAEWDELQAKPVPKAEKKAAQPSEESI
jgi:hypothetical protein